MSWASPGRRIREAIWPEAITPASEPWIKSLEKRGAMPDRKSLVSMLWFTTSLALMASVLAEPVWTSGPFTVSSPSDSLNRHFALLQGQPTTCLSAARTTNDVLQVNALPSENEEQDRPDAPGRSRVSCLIPCSYHKVPDRPLIAPRSILSLYPLRC